MKRSINREVRELLKLNCDKEYAEFSYKLIPTIEKKQMLGVRLPLLRKLATELYKEKTQEQIIDFIKSKHKYFEEQMLAGFLIGKIKDVEQTCELIEDFVPIINNWSVCDSFCSSLKITKVYPEVIWNFLTRYWNSSNEFEFRFACVMALNYYLKEPYLSQLGSLILKRQNDEYYAKMAVAWLYCSIYPINKEKCKQLIMNEKDLFIYHKALSKLCYSYLVEKQDKELFRAMNKSKKE